MFSGNDFVSHSAAADLSFDYSAQADADADQKVDRDLVKPKEALERMRFAVKQATGFVVFRGTIKRDLLFSAFYANFFFFSQTH